MNQQILELARLMGAVSLNDVYTHALEELARDPDPRSLATRLEALSGAIRQDVGWVSKETLGALVGCLARSSDEQVISGCFYCAALLLQRGQEQDIYNELVSGVGLDGAVTQALAINKPVTLKSPIRPFNLVHNSALFLVYYGYCIAFFRRDCPDKRQDAILQVYSKIEKGKYKEYLDLKSVLEGLRNIPTAQEQQQDSSEAEDREMEEV